MHIVIAAIHCEVSDAVKDYAREKVGRLDKFLDKARKTDVTIHAEPGNNSVELVCSANRGHVFTVNVNAEESVQEAIDLAVDKMGKQLRRYKGRLKSHKGKDNRKKLARDIRHITQRLNQLTALAEDHDDEKTYEDVVDED